MRITCGTCGRDVAVVPDWNRRQGDQAAEYRVTRHRATDRKNKNGKQEICTGSGVRIALPDNTYPEAELARV